MPSLDAVRSWSLMRTSESWMASPEAAKFSLYRKFHSLFHPEDSLLQCVGNSAKGDKKISMLHAARESDSGVICSNSLYFPC